ncbi:MAG: HEAT repeat domain-containing protein [Chthonomonadales bacterium]|nr:HEAT repeat domain-containing protein [Chthonomonadales bacterium]
MNRKLVNYGIFIAVVAIVVGFAVRHSRHMAYLVDSMAGPDPKLRVAAARELVKGEQFMDSITGETVGRRVRIVRALEDWASKDAVVQAVAFLKDPDRPVRDRLSLALVRIGTRTADNLQGLVNGSKDGDGNVRKACIYVLQALGQDDPNAADAILARAIPDTPRRVRRKAFAMRNPAVAALIIPKIVEAMKADPAARTPGGDILGAFTARRAECVAALLPLLNEADDGVCSGGAAALGKVGSPLPVQPLIQVADKRSANVRRVAIGALALIAAPTCEATLTAALNNPSDDNEARARAAVGLGNIASRSAVATLVKALRDDDLRVQTAAVDALAVGGKADLNAVLGALKDPDYRVRARAAEALAGIRSISANGALAVALRDPSSEVRQRAATAMAFPGNAGGVPSLAAGLSNPDGCTASACADALAAIGPPAVPALISSLSGPETVAYLAAGALAKQGAASVASVVQAATSSHIGRFATVSLAANQSDAAMDGLRRLAAHGDPETRRSANAALARLSL